MIRLLLFLIISSYTWPETGRLDRDPVDYSYTNLGLKLSSAGEYENFSFFGSVALPGPLYATFSNEAVNASIEERNDSYDFNYDKTVQSLRLGAHIGIGDLLSSVSVGSVALNISNFMDVYIEAGARTFNLDNNRRVSTDDKSFANVIAGVRFGDSNDWEGKIFLDFSKEVEEENSFIDFSECDQDEICLNEGIDIQFSDETDRKLGFDIQYNAARYFGVNFGIKTSQYLETEYFFGLQLQY